MAITYPLTMPTTPAPNSVTVEVQNVVGITESPFTGSQQVFEWPCEYVTVSYKFPPMTRSSAAVWIAFLAALRGKAGTFYAGVQGNEKTARGLLGGTPVVRGANAAGSKALLTRGWTANKANIVRAGDWFSVGNQLVMSLNDANADASGYATLDIYPRLRVAQADGAALDFTAPVGLFRLKNNNRKWDINGLQHYGIVLDAREAF